MNILVTGAKGFVGRNQVENLKCIRDGKNRTRPELHIGNIYEYDIDNTLVQLDAWCGDCDFVFNLAGVNRPKDPAEFKKGNFGFASTLLDALKKHGNRCTVMLSSSLQATLAGRYGTSEYGLSKRDGENLFFDYADQTGAAVYVYRFPNLVGKWVRPNYNSAVGTFCNNIANDLPITVNDPSVELELLFVDDLIEAMYDALEGRPRRCEYPRAGEIVDGVAYDGLTPRWCEDGRFCGVPISISWILRRRNDCKVIGNREQEKPRMGRYHQDKGYIPAVKKRCGIPSLCSGPKGLASRRGTRAAMVFLFPCPCSL